MSTGTRPLRRVEAGAAGPALPAAGDVPGDPYAGGYDGFGASVCAWTAVRGLPDEVRSALTGFRASWGASGAMLFLGLVPVPGDLPPTPSVPFADWRRPVGTEAALLACAFAVGEPIGLADWHGGDRLQNLYPLRRERAAQNASNAVELEVHTESAFRPDTPDALMLLCLRADPRAVTTVCDLRQVRAELPAATAALLDEHAFAFRIGDGALTPPLPIRSPIGPPSGDHDRDGDRHHDRYHYADALAGITPRHDDALGVLRQAIWDASVTVTLRSGDLLLLDNTHIVHGRSAYEPRYDGSDRWLQRCLLARPQGR